MGTLGRNNDPNLNMVQRHDAEISDIIDEANRQADELDTLNTGLKIISRGSITTTFVSGAYTEALVDVQSGTLSTFMAYFSRSDRPGQLYTVPHFEFDGSGNLAFVIYASTQTNKLLFNPLVGTTGSPPTPDLEIFWYAFEQPAGIVLS